MQHQSIKVSEHFMKEKVFVPVLAIAITHNIMFLFFPPAEQYGIPLKFIETIDMVKPKGSTQKKRK